MVIMRKIIILQLAVAAWFCLQPASELRAQNDLNRIQGLLESSMAKQTILTENDVKTYLAHSESIYLLRFDPARVDEVIKETGWTGDRFAYVTTKMAVGMSVLLRPDDPRNRSIPSFAQPSGVEKSIIMRYQEALDRTMEQVQARHAPSPAAGG